jgi:hypothetical protein
MQGKGLPLLDMLAMGLYNSTVSLCGDNARFVGLCTGLCTLATQGVVFAVV